MLRIDTSKPYSLVYSLCKHQFLGYLIEPHIVQLNQDGDFSLTYQRIFSNTATDFVSVIQDDDKQLIHLCEEIEQATLIKKMHKKPVRPQEFFTKIFDQKLFDYIRPKIDKKIAAILALLTNKNFYLMSKEGWPVEKKLSMATEATSVLFHFRRNEEEVRYFPTIKYQGLRIEFMYKDAQVVCNEPAWLLLEECLYYFEQDMDGRKLTPFLNKRYIAIPRKAEKTYFDRFVAPLIAKHHVYAEGFDIQTHQHDAKPILRYTAATEGGAGQLQLNFQYGPYVFSSGGDHRVTVRIVHHTDSDQYVFHRIKRSRKWEENRMQELLKLGLRKESGLFDQLVINKDQHDNPQTYQLLNWISANYQHLIERGFEIEQAEGKKKYLLGSTRIDVSVEERNDWFDIHMLVRFGRYEIPFIQLREHILNEVREFILPDGEVAIIPELWFTQFGTFFKFSSEKDAIKLKKHHLGLIDALEKSEMRELTMDRKLQRLQNFERIEEVTPPQGFRGRLRSYQQAGYDWFFFLKKYHFGGCLADDMGLGKTVQTLALLQKELEMQLEKGKRTPSLLVMPTSLIYNWQREAEQFAPELRILVHTGPSRSKSASAFSHFDLVITTYGITRMDEELLHSFYFHYVILDESQNIKNPTSKAFKAVRKLNGNHRLLLSGTPIENTVADIWPQMAFLNPGLLGRHAQFMNDFVQPIERKKDEDASRKLQALIKPFILRRTKEQVAKELPAKTEKIFYCQMSESQYEYYERTKSEYRNTLLEQGLVGLKSESPIKLLQGLSKLRQLANHPLMIDDAYTGDSGKFENVIHTLKQVLNKGHKVLIFSQFVKQLRIYRTHFDRERIRYAYLDGATKNREEAINHFRNDEAIQLFLISMKAGGVGLNLTEADYVFILDPWWNPAVEQQAIDRSHRIGQTKNVFIYRFITRDSVEEKILTLQNRKRVMADNLITIEESFIKSLTTSDIHELLS